MIAALRYGIELGQVYAALDGSRSRVVVKDVQTFSHVDDVVVYDEQSGEEKRINAYWLARLKYHLVDFKTGDNKQALLNAVREGTAQAEQQQRLAKLFQALQYAMAEQQPDVRRGRFLVDHGEWRYLDDKREGKRTWLCARVAPDADLSCIGTRASALDAAIRQHEEQQAGGAAA